MPNSPSTTREQTAATAMEWVVKQEWFEPQTLRRYLRALLDASLTPPVPPELFIDGAKVSLRTIQESLERFNASLPTEKQVSKKIFDLSDSQILLSLDDLVVEVSGVVPTAPEANIPVNLKELVAEARRAKESRQQLGRQYNLDSALKQALETYRYTQQLRNTVNARLFAMLQDSSYTRDLQSIYGKDAVNRMLLSRVDAATSQAVTMLSVNQLGLTDPSQATSAFTAQLIKAINSDKDALKVAFDKVHPQTKKNTLADIKAVAQATIEKAQSAAVAFRKEQAQSPARASVASAIAKGDIETAAKSIGITIAPGKQERLVTELAKHISNPARQEQIIARVLPSASKQERDAFFKTIAPSIAIMAAAADRPTIAELTQTNSLIWLARTNPELFPPGVVARIRSGHLARPETTAVIAEIANRTGLPLDVVTLRLAGGSSALITRRVERLKTGVRTLGLLPTQRPLSATDERLLRLGQAAGQLRTLETALSQAQLPPSLINQFRPLAQSADRLSGWHSFLNFFRIDQAVSHGFSRIGALPTFQPIGGFISGFRVESGPVNSAFNFFGSVGRGIGNMPSIVTSPFRAVGGLVNRGVNNVKTWAGGQIKAGLAKAGSWLAKKGITEGAKKLGGALLAKGTAALLAQTAPIVGQIAAVLTLLSALGDIGKFLWENRKEIGMGLGGMFLLGQILLAKILAFLGAAAWTLGGALLGGIIGFAIGGPIGALIGAGIGGAVGWLIGSGALGSLVSGIGSLLGSAATGLSSLIGSLTAPSLVAGLGSTVATVGISGIAAGWVLTTFFIQPTINSAMRVEPDAGSFPSGGGPFPSPLPFDRDCPQGWPVDTSQGQKYFVNQGPGGPVTHGPPGNPWVEGIDIHPTLRLDPTKHFIISTHSGVALPFYGHPAGGDGVGIVSKCAGFDFLSLYAHMSVVLVSYGEQIKPGQVLGIIGQTGHAQTPHVHYEFEEKDWTIKNREFSNPPLMMPPYIPEEVPATCVYRDNCHVDIP